ncbi:MAG: PIG-L deacetylase family protein [Kiritimatiellia bacterium]
MSTFEHLSNGIRLSSTDPASVFSNWKGDRERWLFVSPHDDDVILGSGLLFLSAVEAGIKVSACVTTLGDSGYCTPEQRETIASIRRAETLDSFRILGLPEDQLFFLNYHDCGLEHYTGHYPAIPGPTTIAGSTGLSNSFVWLLRHVRPTRVFMPTSTDIHPDHQIVHREMSICAFHAQGSIWPELGKPLEEIPELYEFSTYSDFPSPPDFRVITSEALLERKLTGIMAYRSQEQIGALIQLHRENGTREYFRHLVFPFLVPGKYNNLFDSTPVRP